MGRCQDEVVLALRNRGVQAALLAAVLFGAGTPIAKLLLGDVSPWLLAGLLYCGSGLGLGLIRLIRDSPAERLHRHELPPLVVETNERAVRLWESFGFTILATVPEAFRHPDRRLVGLHIMHRFLR